MGWGEGGGGQDTAVLAGNATFLKESVTQGRKRFITQSKHDILIK